MFSIRHLYGNYLGMLADTCPDSSCADDVRAAVTLARGALRVGSHIDVYLKNRFWEAVIVAVRVDRFKFRFLHTGRRREYGWIFQCDFLRLWRFPVRGESDVWKAQLVAECCVDML
jgi:hypothetical protein